MNHIHTIRVGGVDYPLRDAAAPQIDDTSDAADKLWSAQKLTGLYGDISTALDGILAIQNQLIGGETQ